MHTPASRLLRTDDPQSMRALAMLYGANFTWRAFEQLEHSARTGATALSLTIPDGIFAYLRTHPDESKIFNAAMTAKSHADNAATVAAYDFSAFGTVADIGGGRGHLLRAVLDANPALNGILFDLPQGLPERSAETLDRIALQSGDFFKDPLPRADVYLVSNVIHDFQDREAGAVLTAVRQAAHPSSRVLVLESVIPDGPEPHPVKTLDIMMLAVAGGRERTEREYRNLLAGAGLRLTRVIPTATWKSIIEAVPE